MLYYIVHSVKTHRVNQKMSNTNAPAGLVFFGNITCSFGDVRKSSENYICKKMGVIVDLMSSFQLFSQCRRALFYKRHKETAVQNIITYDVFQDGQFLPVQFCAVRFAKR